MNLICFRSFSALALWSFVAADVSLGAEPDRLMPTEQQTRVSVSAKQDGRAVDIALNNSSQLVLTGGNVECYAERRASSCSPKRPPGGLISFTAEDLLPAATASAAAPRCTNYIDLPHAVLAKPIEAKVLPGKMGRLYAELADGVTLGQCVVSDLRGRERSFFDGF
jgi:hypothetical protein